MIVLHFENWMESLNVCINVVKADPLICLEKIVENIQDKLYN